MKTGITELVLLIGKSCSEKYAKACADGFDTLFFRRKLNVSEGEVIVTTMLFDDSCHIIHDRVDIHALQPITKEDFIGSGSSAWTSAINTAIDKTNTVLRHTNERFRPDKVLYVIITDTPMHSDKFKMLKKKITHCKEKNSSFLLCGYDMNDFMVWLNSARRLGLDYENIISTFRTDNENTFFLGLLGDISRFISCKTSEFICMYATEWCQKLYTIRSDNTAKGAEE